MQKDIFKTMEPEMKILGVTPEELRSSRRDSKTVDARSLLAALLRQRHGMRQVDIATLFGITQVAVSKMLSRHRTMMLYNAPYRRLWQSVSQHSDERRPQ